MIGYSIDQYYRDIKWIATSVQVYIDEVKTESLKWDPDVIVAVARGGCVPGVYLSHLLDKPLEIITWQLRDGNKRQSLPYHYFSNGRQALIVDDINDTGITFEEIFDNIVDNATFGGANSFNREKLKRNVKTASLWQRSTSKFSVDICPNKIDSDDWIIFPWEVPPSGSHSKT